MVLEKLAIEELATVTLDFDGSVISTSRKAEVVEAGFNKKKGERTLAQSGKILDALHRSGNLHDSNGAGIFVEAQPRSCSGAAKTQG